MDGYQGTIFAYRLMTTQGTAAKQQEFLINTKMGSDFFIEINKNIATGHMGISQRV